MAIFKGKFVKLSVPPVRGDMDSGFPEERKGENGWKVKI
jgi:hypothetical protein